MITSHKIEQKENLIYHPYASKYEHQYVEGTSDNDDYHDIQESLIADCNQQSYMGKGRLLLFLIRNLCG